MKQERSYPKVYVTNKAERAVKGGHPWVYGEEIRSMEGTPENGGLVDVLAGSAYLGTGFYNDASKITVRLISRSANDRFDAAFWRRRVEYALRYRRTVMPGPDFKCCRLIHGEADQMPGLTVDRYDTILSVQVLSLGMERVKDVVFAALLDVLREMGEDVRGIYERNDVSIRLREGLEEGKGWYPIEGLPAPESAVTEIVENGVSYLVDVENGQKTGFFVDQRENRHLLETYSKGRSVLNMFCYTGGFSVYAMRGGAKLVHSVDSSAKAIELTNRNIALNFPGDERHAAFCEDAFKFLDANDKTYDLIVLDPPAFAKHRAALRNALKGYTRLNVKGLQRIKPGGILFTFSCSQIVTKENFRNAVFTAAVQANRKVRILHQIHQPADHPINIYHPEGEYLKGLVLYVE